MYGYALIRFIGSKLKHMSLRGAHDKYIAGLKLIAAALNQIAALAGYKVKNLHPLMSVYLKILRARMFINGVMAVNFVIAVGKKMRQNSFPLFFFL